LHPERTAFIIRRDKIMSSEEFSALIVSTQRVDLEKFDGSGKQNVERIIRHMRDVDRAKDSKGDDSEVDPLAKGKHRRFPARASGEFV